MRRLLPNPVVAGFVLVLWLVLTGPTRGNLVLGAVLALIGTHTLKLLEPEVRRVRRWDKVVLLCAITAWDIFMSNVAVAWLILRGPRSGRRAGFVAIDLRLRARPGLAWLAVIVTSTPGTAWIAYDPARGQMLLHVFDLKDPEDWRDTICNRYESLLLEIFE